MLSSSVILSALVAGIIAILVTLAIERWGGLTGGLLGTMPSTIVPAAAGISLAGNQELLNQTLSIIPLGMLINGIFLAVWIYLPAKLEGQKHPLLLTTITALFVWFIFGLLMLQGVEFALDHGVTTWQLGFLGLSLLIVLAIAMNWKVQPTPKGKQPVARTVLVLRGSAAACAIGAAVWLSAQGQPFVAGLAAVFPAIFLTSMVALWLAQGPTVPQGAAGPMAMGGASVAIYALVAMYSLPAWGVIFGSLAAWVIAVFGWSLPAFLLLRKRVITD
jgi:hypothetical protein|tara:strand:- start:137 stop:961 length:825 start_codon:yes stop_codon:yes gene_type:complete